MQPRSPMQERFGWQHVVSWLLPFAGDGVLGGGGKNLSSILKRDRAAGGIIRAIFCTKALDVNYRANLEDFFLNTAPHENARRRCRESPIRDVALIVLHVQIKPDVRVTPFHSRECSRYVNRFARIVLCRE